MDAAKKLGKSKFWTPNIIIENAEYWDEDESPRRSRFWTPPVVISNVEYWDEVEEASQEKESKDKRTPTVISKPEYGDKMEETRKGKSKFWTPQVVVKGGECWDDEPECGTYDPEAYCERNPVIRCRRQQGEAMKPAARRKFRKEERRRWAAFENKGWKEPNTTD